MINKQFQQDTENSDRDGNAQNQKLSEQTSLKQAHKKNKSQLIDMTSKAKPLLQIQQEFEELNPMDLEEHTSSIQAHEQQRKPRDSIKI
jgi:hypothetical protein